MSDDKNAKNDDNVEKVADVKTKAIRDAEKILSEASPQSIARAFGAIARARDVDGADLGGAAMPGGMPFSGGRGRFLHMRIDGPLPPVAPQLRDLKTDATEDKRFTLIEIDEDVDEVRGANRRS